MVYRPSLLSSFWLPDGLIISKLLVELDPLWTMISTCSSTCCWSCPGMSVGSYSVVVGRTVLGCCSCNALLRRSSSSIFHCWPRNDPSVRAMTQQAKQFPVTLIEVLPISMIASTPMITVTAEIGRPYYEDIIRIGVTHIMNMQSIIPEQRCLPKQWVKLGVQQPHLSMTTSMYQGWKVVCQSVGSFHLLGHKKC